MAFMSREEVVELLKKRDPEDEFEWKRGSPFVKKADPNDVGNHLMSMAASNNGVMTIDMLVEDSDNKRSPLYKLVTRDIEMAAMKQRKHELRQVTNNLVIVKTLPKKNNGPIDYVAKTDAFPNSRKEGGYMPMFLVARQGEISEEIMSRLLDQGKRWADKARAFKEFAAAVDAIDNLVEEIDTKA